MVRPADRLTDAELVRLLEERRGEIRESEGLLLAALVAHVEEGAPLSPALRDLAEWLLERVQPE